MFQWSQKDDSEDERAMISDTGALEINTYEFDRLFGELNLISMLKEAHCQSLRQQA
jgi:hypothetical protein